MKYIIEFEDEYSMNEGGMKYHQCKQVPYWSVSHGIIKNLTPYTEPDLNPLVDEAVETIEDEVWELADNIHGMIIQDRMSCFGFALTSAVTSNLSYREAKAKYEAWLKKKDEIHVGDEVYPCNPKAPRVVTKIHNRVAYQMGHDGNMWADDIDDLHKTGRHFDEVADLLEKMRGGED